MMQVLLDARTGPKATGIGQYTLRLAEALATQAPDEVVIAASEAHHAGLEASGASVVAVADGAALPTHHRGRRFDLVHGTNFHAPELDGVPGVATIHDLGFLTLPDCHPPGMPERLDAIIKASIPRTRHFICDSNWTAREFNRHYAVPPERCSTVYLGVDERFSPLPMTGRRPTRTGYLLHVGAMIKRKDLATLMAAYELALKRNPGLKLVLVGNKTRRWASDWPAVARWRRRHPLLRRNVKVLNYVPDDRVPELYRRARAVISTALIEGFGLVALEGLASGVPVIASSGSAIEEIVGDHVFMAEPRNPASFAFAIDRALSAGSAQRAAGAAKAAEFTWRRTAEATLAAYRLAVNRRG